MEKTIALPEDLLMAVAEIAQADGKTPEQVIEEVTRQMLRVRGLRSFVAENGRVAKAQGLSESDVSRLIEESRADSRGR
jgi:hypothetical protein